MAVRRIYRELTNGLTTPVRAEDLVHAVPGLPTREQAVCYFSPALVRNLEENWRAHERGD